MDLQQGDLGNALKKARNDKRLTQEKLAEIIDISPVHLKQLESGRRYPSYEVLLKLVDALEFSLDALLSRNGDNTCDLRIKINRALDKCSDHELRVAYAMIEALREKT